MRHPLRDSRPPIALIPPGVLRRAAGPAKYSSASNIGTALYQNFPCQFDSIGWVPSNPEAAKTTSTPLVARQAKPKAPVNVAATVKSVDPSEPRVGMTTDEIRAILGEPLEAVQDARGDGSLEIWRYVDRNIQFNRKHRVVVVETW